MRLLYTLSIYIYAVIICIASLFNQKAKLWLKGRKNIFDTIKSTIGNQQSTIIWFHCASLGEFEQGRPLMEKLKIRNPNIKILLTFFSPSGYEIRKNYSGADWIFYLPIDTPTNAKKFIKIVKPTQVFFVKYEFWFNYLINLKKQNIPTYLVSGIFREQHYFFKSYATWFRKQLNTFTHFYLQDKQSEKLLHEIGYKNTTVTGDTRFDRVSEISKNVKTIPIIETFKQGNKIIVAGSTWTEDDKIISESLVENYKLIIASHEINEGRIQSITQHFNHLKTVRFSGANSENVKDAQVLIIDNIGMLSSIYQYGTIAFIGGGFGKGIHNILEAATFGLPVICGPNYEKFAEAKELIKAGGAFSVNDAKDLKKCIALLSDPNVLQIASHVSKHYVNNKIGATEKILNSIKI